MELVPSNPSSANVHIQLAEGRDQLGRDSASEKMHRQYIFCGGIGLPNPRFLKTHFHENMILGWDYNPTESKGLGIPVPIISSPVQKNGPYIWSISKCGTRPGQLDLPPTLLTLSGSFSYNLHIQCEHLQNGEPLLLLCHASYV